MKITADLLMMHDACYEQVAEVRLLWPDGVEPTIDVLAEAAVEGLDPWWLWHLLPAEGPGSRRAYALWCAKQVAHLSGDQRVAQCLAVVRRRVEDPSGVSDEELHAYADAAAYAAYADDAAYADAADAAAACAACAAYAYADAYAADAAYADMRGAQLACLSQLLCEVEP